MNCEKCGATMTFVGSISRGKMECPVCDADFIKNLDEAEPLKSLEPSYIQAAKARMAQYEDYENKNSGTCPYCSRLTGHNSIFCVNLYENDETTVTGYASGGVKQPNARTQLVRPPYHPNRGDRVDIKEWYNLANYMINVTYDSNGDLLYHFNFTQHGHDYIFKVLLHIKDYHAQNFIGEVL